MNRYQVWLDGLSLHDIDPSIRVVDVKEHAPDNRLNAVAKALGDGQHITHRSRSSLSVTISFVIREYVPRRRKAIMQRIRAWAQGRVMQLDDRPGQRLTVEVESLPDASALKWTETCAITFIACVLPYWEEADPVTATPAAPSLSPPGTAPSCSADFTWRASHSGAVSLSIQTPLSRITFSQLPVTTGQAFTLTHESGMLVARLDGTDVLPFRTPDSSDDLLVTCGSSNTVAVTVDGTPAADYTLSARGLWL